MKINDLLIDAYEFYNSNNLYYYELDDFIQISIEASIKLLEYIKNNNFYFLIKNNYLEEYSYIIFEYDKYIENNDLFKKYGIILENIDIKLFEKENKVNKIKIITRIKYPIKELINLNDEKILKLKK